MKLTRKQKAWEQKHKPVKQPLRRRTPRDYKFDMDSGHIVFRAHGGSGKPIEEV